jgi:diadenosine tetraphosphatase ApaH/serine/threonine PP2A family protein phosphatase
MAADRVAVLGGVYSNHVALRAAIADARARGAAAIYCLGDLGAFGPHPDRAIEIVREEGVVTLAGNYDDSIGRGLDDCQCGYTDPRDNHFARISYRYTFENTSSENRAWLAALPREIRIDFGPRRVLMCHGSPRRVNEFLWESTTPTHFLEKLCDDTRSELILATHTGQKWQRALAGGGRFVNVGVVGRPENDGTTRVHYALLDASRDEAEFVPVEYEHEALAREMEKEKLPGEFIETIRTGWWTTCLEVLPSKERRRGRY